MVGLPSFGKKNSAPRMTATDRVRGLSNQGFSEPEIIRTLRNEGYSPADVDRALKMAIRDTASPQGFGSGGNEFDLPRPGEPFRNGQNFNQGSDFPMPGDSSIGQGLPPAGQPMPPPPKTGGMDLPAIPGIHNEPPKHAPKPPHAPKPIGPPGLRHPVLDEEFDDDNSKFKKLQSDIPRLRGTNAPKSIERAEVEEVIEGIIEEKWDLVEKELGEFEERMKNLSDKMKTIEDHVNLLKEKRREDQEDVKSSVAAYKEAVGELSMKIDATQNTMKSSLAPMLQTLRSLSDTLKMLKESKG